jgi:hypothetical protein
MHAILLRLLHRLQATPSFGVSSAPDRCARRPPSGPRELTDSTLPPASDRRAIGERATVLSRARTVRSDRTVSASNAHALFPLPRATSSAGPGRQAEAQPACQPAVRGRSQRPVGGSLGPDRPLHCAQIKILFSDLFNHRNISKLLEFIENCRCQKIVN